MSLEMVLATWVQILNWTVSLCANVFENDKNPSHLPQDMGK